jgi:hypothetical protein
LSDFDLTLRGGTVVNAHGSMQATSTPRAGS